MADLKRKAEVGKGCVACGACVKVCPMRAVSVFRGSHAVVDKDICVGCKKCVDACPAGVIFVVERRLDKK